ncbi:unnamed protein product [Caenorhabditis auriculariae]|uniref:ubiquitinyl hydrolase 1 n=1 Tax=Caenorhabditis auriculariae TaxID=2777116 RepID=A0A8S1HBX5_9PELO|nr:unnamed protein product [Caenorhabditis auriculariae]
MTILPPFKKKSTSVTVRMPVKNNSGSDLRNSTGNLQLQPCGPQGNARRMKNSPRPSDLRSQPPAKRTMYQPPSSLTSPLGSPRGSSSVHSLDDHHQLHSNAGDSATQGIPQKNNLSSGTLNNNSDDEYELEYARDEQVEKEFADRLQARGLTIKEMEGDGACMFRAIAEQVYGDQEMHGQIRDLCMNYMENNRDYYRDFIVEDFDQYIARKRLSNVHGNHVELQAISEMFARPVEVYQYSDEPINILLPRNMEASGERPATEPAQQNAPLRLSYHGAVHYNAIVDPHAATIGVGLGLPGMVPGAAEASLLADAMIDSERNHLEETMLQDKLKMTDWQRTQVDMEEQIARESYLDYVRSVDQRKPKMSPQRSPHSKSPISSPKPKKANSGIKSPSPKNQQADVPADKPSTSRAGLYEELLAAQSLDWETYDEDVATAEAMLLSRQDFMAKLEDKSGNSSKNDS